MGRIPLVLALASLVACARAGGSDTDAASGDGNKPTDGVIDSNGCATQPCSILPQCGCIGLSACDVDGSDGMGTACRTISTPGHETATCDTLDDCDKGFVCLGSMTYATCRKYCTADADCGTPRGKCVIDVSSGGMPLAGIPTTCSSNCDPASTTVPECPQNSKCGMFTTTHNSTSYQIGACTLAGTGTQGTTCAGGNDALCNKGYSCTTTDGGTTYKCRRVCTNPGTASSAQCGGQACIAFTTPFTLAGVTYGVCAP